MYSYGWAFMKKYESGGFDVTSSISRDGIINCTKLIVEIDEWKDNVFKKD